MVMKKNEFICIVINMFIAGHTKWSRVNSEKRSHHQVVGRVLGQAVFVYLDFSARTDRLVYGQGVGWSKSLDSYKAYLARTENEEQKFRDGSLRRLLALESPRDFQYDAMDISTSALCRPIGGFNASELSLDQIKADMLREIEEYALPYLCLMLKHRHGVVVTPEQLGSGELTIE
jgi:hypothetical protein